MNNNYIKHILLCLALLTSTTAFAYDACIDGIYYNFSNGEATVTYKSTNYNSYSGKVTIPGFVIYQGTTYSVTSIGNYAFYRCSSLTSVTIPNSVTSIGNSAFYRCSSLTSVTIPNSVTSIGYYAFSGCSGLTSVTIPNSVTSIGDFAFYGCSGLTSVYITDLSAWCSIIFKTDDSNPLYYAHHLFLNGEEIEVLNIPEDVTSIGGWAFSGCSGLTSVTIPNSVTSIGRSAFSGCSGLTSITIPNSVTSIGSEAFRYCRGLTSVTIPNSVTSIGSNAFSGCSGLTSVTIPERVTSIGDYAFAYCSGLTSVTIPESVTSIGNYAFEGCSSLTSVTIPESVTSIGSNAFDGTAWYNNQPDGLVYAGKVAYKHKGTMPDGTDISIKDGTLGIAGSAFDGCSGLISVTIPESVTSIGEMAFSGCSGLTSITIPNSVTSIGSYAFYGCSGLTSVTIGSGVTSIGWSAFEDCSGLKDFYCYAENAPALESESDVFINSSYGSATLYVSTGSVSSYQRWGFGSTVGYFISFADANVKTVCVSKWDTNSDKELDVNEAAVVTDLGSAFNGKSEITSFKELQYFTGLTTISYRAFFGCSNLTSLTIPAGVTSIGNSAFNGCSGLTSVSLPISLTNVGGYVFQGCSGLTAVHISDLKAWCNISFGNSTSQPLTYAHHLYLNGREVTELVIPDGVTDIGSNAFAGCSGLTSLTIRDGVLSIGNNAFSGCSGLTTIIIPNSVTSIDNAAFYKCSALTDVYCYAEDVPATNSTAFSNASITSATLHVPDISIDSYRQTAPWNGFGTIVTLSPNIIFADANVKAICVANFDTNGDGELVLEEIAAVTDLGPVFSNSAITSFDELQYFTGLTSISSKAFSDCSGLTSVTIPNSVTSIGISAFSRCTSLTSITIPKSVTYIGDGAFDYCLLRNVLVKCTTPPGLFDDYNSNEPGTFSRATCHHATLYVPIGTWDAYAFSAGWFWFNNIRETAMAEDEVSEQSAYTLMDAGTFAYSVYDPVNDCIGTINSAGSINEDNPNHSWQMMEAGGLHYLYNIGAKKYAKREGNSLCLCDEPTPIDVADGDNGLILAGETGKQWALVSNERLNASQAAIDQVTGIMAIEHSPLNIDHSIYNMSGQRLSKPQKGLNIVGGRKVLMK